MDIFCYCNGVCETKENKEKHDLSVTTKQARSFFSSHTKTKGRKRQSMMTHKQMERIQERKKVSIRQSIHQQVPNRMEVKIGKDVSSFAMEREMETGQDNEILKNILQEMRHI